MSSRHRAHLQQQRDISLPANDEDEEEIAVKLPTAVFSALVSSSESSSSDEEDEFDCLQEKGNETRNLEEARSVNSHPAEVNVAIRKCKRNKAISQVKIAPISQLPTALQVNEKLLSIDDFLRSRFGDLTQETGIERPAELHVDRKQRRALARMRGEQKYRRALRRKCLFGAPKEEWPRHVPFIAGGIRIVSINDAIRSPPAATHVIEWSPEYISLQNQYESIVAGSGGDVNTLVMFLMHHPHHLDSMLQLAMVFAHTGQMDRASDLIHRCLYHLESAHSDGFGAGSRLNPALQQNRCYFTALFRQMQIASMMGCPAVAANLCKYLLLLDPTHDPYHMLLFLDTYLTTARQHSQIFEICTDNNIMNYLALPVPLDELLPNWSFSRCIAECNVKSSIDAVSKLSVQLLKWPLHAIMLADVILGSDNALSNSSFFQHFAKNANTYPVLQRLANIYSVASRVVWNRDEFSAWLRQAIVRAASSIKQEDLDSTSARLNRAEHLPELQRYSTAQVDDFKEEFSRLPPDMHPLDPQLADPRILHRLPENMRRVNNVNRRFVQQQQRRQQQDHWIFAEEAQPAPPVGYRIDLNLPLMNIFILSFLPWFRIET